MKISFEKLTRLLADLYDQGLDVFTVKERVARLLRTSVGCDIVTFAGWNSKTKRLTVDFDTVFEGASDGVEGFGRHFREHPCFNFDPTFNCGRAFIRGDFLARRCFVEMPVFREGFQKAGLSDHAAVYVGRAGDEEIFIGLERQTGEFRIAQREQLQILQPHFRNAFWLARQVSDWRSLLQKRGVLELAGLTPRQEDVLRWFAMGKTLDETASILGLSVPTVKEHTIRLYERLGVETRASALARAEQLAREFASVWIGFDNQISVRVGG